HSLEIDVVTEIFIRINQKGVVLSNADFVMSKIASDEAHGGNKMRKLVDYFCRLIVDKDFNKHIVDNDPAFASSDYYEGIKWMANGTDQLYIPDYVDALRVAFTFQFKRGKFSDLVALLSGRNFEERTNEESIAEASYQKLSDGLMQFVNQTNYQRFLMILQSAGFIHPKLISSQNSINFAYALYLKLRNDGLPEAKSQHFVKRWLVLSLLIGRYSGSVESFIDEDIKQMSDKGIEPYLKQMEQAYLDDGFWGYRLIDDLESSSPNNNAYNVYLAAQCYLGSPAFLAKNMKASSLIEQRGDIHHLFPRKYLTDNGHLPRSYNQIANFAYTEQATNIKIGKMAPVEYLSNVEQQISDGVLDLCSLTTTEELEENLRLNDIPPSLLTATHDQFPDFLEQRRKLMALKIKDYYQQL
ncbi:MAG: hypothetical protein ACPG32_15485, partial [Akkermansiaceae bacterium]